MSNQKLFAYIDESYSSYSYFNKPTCFLGNAQIAESNFLTAIYRACGFNYPKFFKMDELSKAAFLVTEMVLDNLPFQLDAKTTGVVFFNRVASLPTDRHFEATISDAENFYPSPSSFVYTLPNIMCGEVCIRHGFQGESAFYVVEQYDGEQIMNICRDMLATNSAVVLGLSDISDYVFAYARVLTAENLKS